MKMRLLYGYTVCALQKQNKNSVSELEYIVFFVFLSFFFTVYVLRSS